MTGVARGKLIILNGGSSAGKTSVAQAFQDLAAECWMHIGIDLFWFALPPEQLDLARVRPEYYTWESVVEADGLEWFTVHPGPLLDRAMHARYRAIRAYLDNGMNVIADDVIWKRQWLVDALRIFDGCQVWMVGCTSPTRRALAGRRNAATAIPGGTGEAPAPPMPMPNTTSSWTPPPPRPGAGAGVVPSLPALSGTAGIPAAAAALPALTPAIQRRRAT